MAKQYEINYRNGTIRLKHIPDYNSGLIGTWNKKLKFWTFLVYIGNEVITSGNQYTNKIKCLNRAKQLIKERKNK